LFSPGTSRPGRINRAPLLRFVSLQRHGPRRAVRGYQPSDDPASALADPSCLSVSSTHGRDHRALAVFRQRRSQASARRSIEIRTGGSSEPSLSAADHASVSFCDRCSATRADLRGFVGIRLLPTALMGFFPSQACSRKRVARMFPWRRAHVSLTGSPPRRFESRYRPTESCER